MLLVGAGEGGIGIRTAVRATLAAVQDLQRDCIVDPNLGPDVLDEIELVELYEDNAILAAHAVADVIDAEPEVKVTFIADPEIGRGEGASRAPSLRRTRAGGGASRSRPTVMTVRCASPTSPTALARMSRWSSASGCSPIAS
jgi:hypothetical protein